jgi:hypothetical protein
VARASGTTARNGCLLLCRGGNSLAVHDPIYPAGTSPRVRRPPAEHLPLSGTEYIEDCLLGGHGEGGAASFRVVSVQRDGQRLRAMEYRSGTPDWRCHPLEMASMWLRCVARQCPGLIFWRCDKNSYILLNTSTMAFCTVALPLPLVTLSAQQLRPHQYTP